MTKSMSVYLDAVRILAAFTVVCCHFTFAQFTGGMVQYQDALSTEAVTVFFVLSGYVIAYVAHEKEKSPLTFAISRCARIYSVAIPALILTAAIDGTTVLMGHPSGVPLYEYHKLWLYLPIFLTFTNEIGLLHVKVLTDGAYWSLSYEVWYYLIFFVAYYLSGWQRKLFLPIAVLCLGLPALVYLPVWLMGCGVYYLHTKTSLPRKQALTLGGLTLLFLCAFHIFGLDVSLDTSVIALLGRNAGSYLHNSLHFALHYTVGAIVALHFYAMNYGELRFLLAPRIKKIITTAASFTFATYLGHRPLMNFWAAVIRHDPHSAGSIALLFVLVMGSAIVFGFASEHRKKEWRTLFRSVFGLFGMAAEPANVPRPL